MGKAFNYELPIYFYLVGILFSLLPDSDLLLIKIGLVKDHHQFPTHYPLISIPVICLFMFGIVMIYKVAYPGFWVSVATLCLFFHYIDDTWGRTSGIGLRWLMPWGKKYYSFWPRRVLTEKEIKEAELLSPEQWVEYHYLRLTPELLLGVAMFLVGLALVFLW